MKHIFMTVLVILGVCSFGKIPTSNHEVKETIYTVNIVFFVSMQTNYSNRYEIFFHKYFSTKISISVYIIFDCYNYHATKLHFLITKPENYNMSRFCCATVAKTCPEKISVQQKKINYEHHTHIWLMTYRLNTVERLFMFVCSQKLFKPTSGFTFFE